MQRRAVNNFIKAWRVTMVDEQRPYALAALKKIKSRLAAAHPIDADTRAHYDDLATQIQLALDYKLDTRSSAQ